MLVTFKSKAAGDILMFEENARQILDLFGKEISQGIITWAETGKAIEILEKEITRQKIEDARKKEEREKEEREAEERRFRGEEEEETEEDKDPYEKKPPKQQTEEIPVSFAARAYPFMQMLLAANKKERDIVWGV